MSRLVKLAFTLLLVALPCFGSEIAVLRNGFTIRCEHRQIIGGITRLYTTSAKANYIDVPTDQIDHFEADFSPPPVRAAAAPRVQDVNHAQNVNEVINSMSQQHHLDPDLVNSVIRAESGFNPRAVSPKGAQGLMQLMPQTASQLGVKNAFDPGANVDGGTRYLRELLERYNFDMVKALAAYNAGPQRVEQYRGIPPYQETRAYVARIIRDFNRKKLAQRKAAGAATTTARKSPAAKQPAGAPGLAQQASR